MRFQTACVLMVLPLRLWADAAVDEKQVDELYQLGKSVAGGGRADFLCAAALGYSCSGNSRKSVACYQELVTDFKGSPLCSIFTNGLLDIECSRCRGTGVSHSVCKRCNGSGMADLLKGTKSRCTLCSGNGGEAAKCGLCQGRGSFSPSMDICFNVYKMMIDNIKNEVTNRGNDLELLESRVLLAKSKMSLSQTIKGRVFQKVRGGGVLVDIFSDRLLYLTGLDGEQLLVDGDPVNAVVYPSGTYEYVSVMGANKTLRRFSCDPWSD